jgi:hypothetical protein
MSKIIEEYVEYKDLLTCKCTENETDDDKFPDKSYGLIDIKDDKSKDVQPNEFSENEDDKCSKCEEKFKFKKRVKTSIVKTEESL